MESAKNGNKVVEYEYTIIWLMLGNKKWYIKVGHNGQEKVAYKYNKDPVEEFPTFLELQLEALCNGLGNCYTTNPSGRAEKSNTTRHLAQFTHAEYELSFSILNQRHHQYYH